MGTTALKGTPVQTSGDLPAVGSRAPEILGTTAKLADVTLDAWAGSTRIVNIFPSVDTAVCATSVRVFNQRAASREGVVVLCVSADLPFALNRFCGAEGISGVETISSFRSAFGEAWGVTMVDGPLRGSARPCRRRRRARGAGAPHGAGAGDRPGA